MLTSCYQTAPSLLFTNMLIVKADNRHGDFAASSQKPRRGPRNDLGYRRQASGGPRHSRPEY